MCVIKFIDLIVYHSKEHAALLDVRDSTVLMFTTPANPMVSIFSTGGKIGTNDQEWARF